MDVFIITVDAGEYCTAHPTDVIPTVDNCAQYYKCSDRITSLGNHREECSYPDLFSSESLSCESFMDVDCSTRAEPKAPCKLFFCQTFSCFLEKKTISKMLSKCIFFKNFEICVPTLSKMFKPLYPKYIFLFVFVVYRILEAILNVICLKRY